MAKLLVNDTTLTAIADAIRAKTETSGTMLPNEMAAKIAGITTGDVRYGTFKGAGSDSDSIFNIGKNIPDGNFVLIVMPSGMLYTANNVIHYAWVTSIDGTITGKITKGGNGTGTWAVVFTIDRATGDVSVNTSGGSCYFSGSAEYMWVFAGGGAV